MHFNRFLLALPLAAGSSANSFHVRDEEEPVRDININKQFIIQVEPVGVYLSTSESLLTQLLGNQLGGPQERIVLK